MDNITTVLKVVRFKKQHIVSGELWHEQGQLCLMLNQDVVPTCGNVGWCLLPHNTDNWNGITLQSCIFYERGYVEDTDINPRTHPGFAGIIARLSEAVIERYTKLIEQAVALDKAIRELQPVFDVLSREKEQRDADACFEALHENNNGELNES